MINMDKDLLSIQAARTLASKGKVAAKKIANFTEEQIDTILGNMVRVAEENAYELAKMAVEETGFGKVEDKLFKNQLASRHVYEEIKDMKTIGVIERDEVNKLISIAEPVGLIMGILPSTNPTSTAIYKSLIAIKSRNAIVFSPHPGAVKCSTKAIKLMHDAAVEAGAPKDIISSLEILSMDATNELMTHPDVQLLLATGGPGMVKAAYSSGTPALGVGAGNSPAYIEKTADVRKAVKNIIASKTFDNGVICSSEQSIIAEEANKDRVIEELKRQGGYFMTLEEVDKVSKLLFRDGSYVVNPKVVGKSPQFIAEAAGISIPEGTKVLIGKQEGVGPNYPLSYEKLTPVLAFYEVKDWKEAWNLSRQLLQHGLGHTMSIHTEDEDMVMEFAKMPASRILVNTGGSQGATGASTSLMPSFTLGCGTWGGSSVSENVSPKNLINVKKVAYGVKDIGTEEAETSPSSCGSKSLYDKSPAFYASNFESGITCNNSQANTCSNAINREDLEDIMNELMNILRGAK